MKKNSDFVRFLAIGLAAVAIAYLFPHITPPKFSEGINDLSSWYIYSFSKSSLSRIKLIGIAVDEYSLNEMQQRWPWKRSVYAQAVKILDKEKVSAIGIDFAFVGDSEDKQEDLILEEALKGASSKIVLAYLFDAEKQAPVLPLAQLREAAYSIGMLNTPQDADQKIRRLRGYIYPKIDQAPYYSFSIALAAAFLKQEPQDLAKVLPLSSDHTYFINYLLRPGDTVVLSFYDLLTDIEGLKKHYGDDFLKGALALIYPQAEILHDAYYTPLGRMPGGLLHLNGVLDIISGRLIQEANALLIPLFIFSFIAVLYILRYFGLFTGALFTLGVLVIDFWCLVFSVLGGVRFGYSYLVAFTTSFFILGSLYKYLSFLTQILKIKDKATVDPLRNLFTLRYFYYRLGLEMKKIYLGRDLYLFFLQFRSFKEITADMPTQRLKEVWQRISSFLLNRGKFWSVYSPDEIVGCIVGQEAKMSRVASFLKNNLEGILQEKELKLKVRIAYARLKKNYSLRESLFILLSRLEKQNREVIFVKDNELAGVFDSSALEKMDSDKFLDSLDEDIETRNQQLLSLIENLNKEHAKTKEAFFQIIASLVNALEARDPYTEGHSERVCNYSLLVAERMNWPQEEKEKLKKAALLHDLGKIGIPDSILHKRGPLNEEEFDFIKKHEIIGVKILEPLKEMNEILPWILYHHERWDGKGYPHGLAGEAIPEAAQIISLADVFDALTTGRDYKNAFSFDDTIKELNKAKGAQFNPRLLDLFIGVIQSQRPRQV